MLNSLFYHLSSLKTRGIPHTRTKGTDGQDEGTGGGHGSDKDEVGVGGGHGSDKDEVGVGESQADVEGARKGPSDRGRELKKFLVYQRSADDD